MEPWQEIQALRKSGELEKALEEGARFLTEDGDHFMLKSQLEWVYFDLIKKVVMEWAELEKANQPPPNQLRNRLIGLLREYFKLEPGLPSMALGNILGKLAPIAKHLPPFPKIVRWCVDNDPSGSFGITADQWKPNVWEGKAYPSVAQKLARGLAAWIKANPDQASDELLDFAIGIAERVHKEAGDDDHLWLEWDLAALHRLAGNATSARQWLLPVLKAKRSEFWVWAEAARLFASQKPAMAISCFCQALRLGKEPKFLGRYHIELAKLLARRDEAGQASHELTVAAEIYEHEGWKPPKELEELFAMDWYDPSLPHDDPEEFYSDHAEQSLALCYDSSETVPATFLGFTEGRDGKRPLPRFGVRDGRITISLLGKRALDTKGLGAGAPIEITIASDGSRKDILDVIERPSGGDWDQIAAESAVVSRVFEDQQNLELYFDRERQLRVPRAILLGEEPPAVGMGIEAGIVTVGREKHLQAVYAKPVPPLDLDDVQAVTGSLRRMDGGFGFVDNVFVPPHLLEGFPEEHQEASVLAVIRWNKKREEWGWQAIWLSPTHQ